jgi:hypothetical protein
MFGACGVQSGPLAERRREVAAKVPRLSSSFQRAGAHLN